MFAVPRRNDDGSITWTDRRGAPETTPLNGLSADDKARASASLRDMLRRIESACDSSPDGQTLLAALNVDSADGIRVADGRPIIGGWGAVPAALVTPDQLAVHHAATLGPFLSRVEPPRFWIRPVEATPLHGRLHGRLHGSWALIAAVALAAFVLLYLLVPGVLRDNVASRRSLALSDSTRSIERQIQTVRDSLAQNVCIATQGVPRLETPLPGSAAPPIGTAPPAGTITTTPDGSGSGGATPPAGAPPNERDKSGSISPGSQQKSTRQGDATPAQPERLTRPSPPVNPEAAPAPPQANPTHSASTVAELLKKSTVLILTGTEQGTGFFVSRDQILTNRHVMENATPRVLVGNLALGQLLPAEVVGLSDSTRFGEPDFALLKLKSGSSDNYLSFSDSLPFELENVIATGYPNFVISGDESFQRLKSGDFHSVPPTALTSGAVTYIQNPNSPSPVVLHYAAISPGNSGGPLTDECGRVVGVNTFVSSNDGANARMNYSLASSSAIAFLKRFNVTPTIAPGLCTTAVAGGPPAPGTPSTQTAPPQSQPQSPQPQSQPSPQSQTSPSPQPQPQPQPQPTPNARSEDSQPGSAPSPAK